jgi:hypothetical protein
MLKPDEPLHLNERKNSLPNWLFLFGMAYAFMHVMPSFLTHDVKNRLNTGDLLNFFTPFVVIPIVWKIFFILRQNLLAVSERKIRAAWILLLFSSILYVNGQGMNLSANAIARHLNDMKDAPVFWLDYFFDETMGHIFWHSGMIGISLSFLLLAAQAKPVAAERQIFAGAACYSFAYFTDAVEGQTVPLLFPSALLILIWILFYRKKQPRAFTENPVTLFFVAGYAMAVMLFLIWWILQGGFPQFSELRWI